MDKRKSDKRGSTVYCILKLVYMYVSYYVRCTIFLLEIPLFHIMTAKVTFGNINGVDSAATHVTLHDTHEGHATTTISMPSSSSGADGLKKRHQGGSSSSQPQESSADPTG